ncbi:peptidoglycan editing factor PgeF [Fodinibius halophilus]|uniref:Purine nucleoside phosphorylase n=1 Tax=Fodinibius halophilus TaxID=1736908 RepID=A0A6M1SSP7_9BACT|nr:peptidoglycan editing factor PgeF [Fodinibius halophilus]NGP86958.1 peptidoglycan editing factor PgeF [Fodinibius halophilus]
MNKLQTDFSVIRPRNLKNEEGIRAWFTLKNEEYGTQNNIPGLNLGFNTQEQKDVIVQNRLNLLSALEVNTDWVAFADQVHGNRVRIVIQGGTYPNTDGLITSVPGLTLAIQVADCAAVLLWDADSQTVGALHAGWRGAAGDIVPRGIEDMVDQGADPQNIKAFVSPCICLENFEVGIEVAERFPDKFVDYERFEKPHVNLPAFLRYQLEESGIPGNHIEVPEECTVENEDRFYSYRREGQKSGRMMALIQIAE